MNFIRLSFFLFPFSLFISLSGYCQKAYYVSTLAGDTAGMRNGGLDSALFNGPTGIATDTSGNVYVADYNNNVIRKINVSTQMVSTLAGDTSGYYLGIDSLSPGLVNGQGLTAEFNYPLGLCVDKYGNVYVADTYNHVIRKIDTGDNVTTYAGDTSGYYQGDIFAQGYVNGADSVAKFSYPTALAIDTNGNIFVADYGNNVVREIWASTHSVTTVAGRGPDTAGYINGLIDTAEFENLFGITIDDSGAIYVTQNESGSNAVRRIYKGMVTTYSGWDTIGIDTTVTAYNLIPSGYYNCKCDTVLYNDPAGLVIDSGNVFVADEYNNVIRKIASDSVVSTFAGNDTIGFVNGWCDSNKAEFFNPIGITVDKKGTFYVTDNGNNSIRMIAQTSLVGIKQLSVSHQLSVYPNPSTGVINFVLHQPVAGSQMNICVYNVMGEQVYSQYPILTTQFPIDLGNQSNGVYFYRVSDIKGGLIGEGKMVIQK